ncbi:transglycosylase SLT domain-containing protein [Leyella stercorea]|jgi:membrane-bound lytic murein transglycosylase F|uniref:transglycosylase SLT domain-containing protein n=1 Tax=Leyella stercorea TaxID=363265 RepID=UPI00241F6BC6|nr:transglycosylase SLT domain-containing protein [Leyella stercorea]
MQEKSIITLLFILSISACTERQQSTQTPWGDTFGTDTVSSNAFSLRDILESGEMVVLTISGPNTYYEYRGKQMGTQYLLCEKFAQKIGVSLRVEVCKSIDEMIKKFNAGDADIIVYQIPTSTKGTIPCGYSTNNGKLAWAVRTDNTELADSLRSWYKPEIAESVKREEKALFSTQSIHRRVYAPMLNTQAGIISNYDHLFKRYAPIARWDWRLLAAQCYQESCFDPKAYSWAGAKGLMQIMPETAKHLGLAESDVYEPELNIYAAARYINELNTCFTDIRNPEERKFFILASYNGGFFHIRDAMALAKKNGKNPHKWIHVAEYVLKLSTPEYYNDPVVKYGYMRGSETANYVSAIYSRWQKYRGVRNASSLAPTDDVPTVYEPHKASKKHRFKLKNVKDN